MTPTPEVREVADAGRRFREARATVATAAAELAAAIRAADKAGTPRGEILAAAGVSKRTFYRALEEDAAPPPEDRPEVVSYP